MILRPQLQEPLAHTQSDVTCCGAEAALIELSLLQKVATAHYILENMSVEEIALKMRLSNIAIQKLLEVALSHASKRLNRSKEVKVDPINSEW